MKVERISESTYRVVEGTLDDLAAHLTARGWVRHDPRSSYEFARFWLGDRQALIIAYLSGTLLSQGGEPWRAFEALRAFMPAHRSIWVDESERPPLWDGDGRSDVR